MKGDWFKKFKESGMLEMSEEDYLRCEKSMEKLIPIYLENLKKGSSILECCCGPGCTAIALSKYYKVTAFDKDERVLDYTMQNAMKYSKDIRIVKADFHNIDEIFTRDSFAACSSDGVMEHYPIDEIQELLDKQLMVAPLVFISVPLGDGKEKTDEQGITNYSYTKKQWLEEILKDYNVVINHTHKPEREKPRGTGEELIMVVKRE